MSPFKAIGPPWWDDRPVYVVAGGMSVKGRNLSTLYERGYVVGVNRAIAKIPCHALFTTDHNFISKCSQTIAEFAANGEAVLAVDKSWFRDNDPIPGAHYVERVQGHGLGGKNWQIVNGLNSGYGALCLAVKKRAKDIRMIAFDLNGKNEHWFGEYDWANGRTEKYFHRWAARFQEIADDLPSDVSVINYNLKSQITAFRKKSYDALGI